MLMKGAGFSCLFVFVFLLFFLLECLLGCCSAVAVQCSTVRSSDSLVVFVVLS